MRTERTGVLVVGAGPVGIMAALTLAEQGIEVTIIDQEERPATHSYACAIHPGTLDILAELDLADEVVGLGRRIDLLGYYMGSQRHAQIDFHKLGGAHPYVLVLPQRDLESVLEKNLARRGIRIRWNHHLSALRNEADGALATVERFGSSAKGYAVPDWDWEVQKRFQIHADFVLGADGHNSHVRRCLEIPLKPMAERQTFAIFEFETDAALGDEVRVVFDNGKINVLWPLPNNRCRWTFELSDYQAEEFPLKEREIVGVQEPSVDRETRRILKIWCQSRAPWFTGSLGEIDWRVQVQFERVLADHFGSGRCWIIGDAAHQTGPIGVQSMNIGVREAADIATIIGAILQHRGSFDLLEVFNRDRQAEWKQMLLREGATARPEADTWVRQHASRILSSIPASGEDLPPLLDQIGIDFVSATQQARKLVHS